MSIPTASTISSPGRRSTSITSPILARPRFKLETNWLTCNQHCKTWSGLCSARSGQKPKRSSSTRAATARRTILAASVSKSSMPSSRIPKIVANLTLSYGLRYQFNGVPYEIHDFLSTLFTNPSGPAPFTFTIAGNKDQGLPPLYKNDWHDFEPRIGLAWDPFKQCKTSIRAGYGIFHDRVFGQLLGLTRGNPPFQQIFFSPTFNPMAGGPAVSTLPLPPTLTATAIVNNEAGNFPFLVDPHLRMP